MLSDRDRLLQLYRERVDNYAGVDDGFRDRWLSWCRMLLAHGGELVVPPLEPEPDLDRLLADGTSHGPQVDTVGTGGDCHANVARMWIEGAIDTVGTGYALFEDLWRQHSWGVGDDGTVLETKWPSERYVGLTVPPGEQTVQFVLANFDGDIKAVLNEGAGRAAEIVRVLRAVRSRQTPRS